MSSRNVARSGSDQQGTGSSAGMGVWLRVTDHVGVTTVKDDNFYIYKLFTQKEQVKEQCRYKSPREEAREVHS